MMVTMMIMVQVVVVIMISIKIDIFHHQCIKAHDSSLMGIPQAVCGHAVKTSSLVTMHTLNRAAVQASNEDKFFSAYDL